MMPFRPLRTWGLGIFGWAVLAAGVYCLRLWADQSKPVAVAFPAASVNNNGPRQAVTKDNLMRAVFEVNYLFI